MELLGDLLLCIVGIGLKPKHVSIEGLETIKACKRAYIEEYTSQYAESSLRELEALAGKQFVPLSRSQVEEEFSGILEEAKHLDVCLAVFGNPMDATTHIQILLDAQKAGTETKIVPATGIFDFVSVCGLERYKFGRTTSIVFHEEGYEPESFYDAILENKKAGLHTLCLLDIRKDESRLMSIKHAISLLESIEERREKAVLSESITLGIAGAGSENQQLKAGTMEQLKLSSFTSFPQCIIVCGKLNEKEIEGMRAFAGLG
ncbi:Diphthine synthase [uncultured archaeon]|nr:Diphthine synthase [uncultured archaeon]